MLTPNGSLENAVDECRTDERSEFESQYRKSTDVVASLCKYNDKIV